jgi:hypothetical protein
MGVAKGTCHFQRFGIDTFEYFSVTRSMFYGTGIVYATEAERYGGKGCRMFLHPSLDIDDINAIHGRYRTLELAAPSEHAHQEVNYLHSDSREPGAPLTDDPDLKIWQGLTYARIQVPEPVDPEVLKHYTDSFTAFNEMRKQHGCDEILPPAITPST